MELHHHNYGFIIFLNGASSSGKTSLAYAIQSFDKENIAIASVDDFLSKKIKHYQHVINLNNEEQSYYLKQFNRSIISLIQAYKLVIVDHVLGEDRAWIDSLTEMVDSYPTCFVKIFCSAADLITRERCRQDRKPDTGHALRQHDSIHRYINYHYEYNTSLLSSSEIARDLLTSLASQYPELSIFSSCPKHIPTEVICLH